LKNSKLSWQLENIYDLRPVAWRLIERRGEKVKEFNNVPPKMGCGKVVSLKRKK
jgi:hypothetical protein